MQQARNAVSVQQAFLQPSNCRACDGSCNECCNECCKYASSSTRTPWALKQVHEVILTTSYREGTVPWQLAHQLEELILVFRTARLTDENITGLSIWLSSSSSLYKPCPCWRYGKYNAKPAHQKTKPRISRSKTRCSTNCSSGSCSGRWADLPPSLSFAYSNAGPSPSFAFASLRALSSARQFGEVLQRVGKQERGGLTW